MIRFFLAVDRAKLNGRCPLTVADLIEKSLIPLIIMGVRKKSVVPVIDGNHKIVGRIGLEYVMKMIGQSRSNQSMYMTQIQVEKLVHVLAMFIDPRSLSNESSLYLSELVTNRIVGSRERLDMRILVDLVRVGRRFGDHHGWKRLGDFAVGLILDEQQNAPVRMRIADLISIGEFLLHGDRDSELVNRWINMAGNSASGPEQALEILRAKAARINMYCEYPDGHRAVNDDSVTAAFCGFFLTITLGLSDWSITRL
jgi:hypothetical protein